jgi:hypothetical protein
LSKRNVKLILKVLSDFEPLRGLSNKKTLYSTRSYVNWDFFGTRGPNLHTNSSNKLLYLTNVTSLLIPQRMNSFNKEEKVNCVKCYYSGLSFRNMQATFPVFYPERPTMSNIIHCHLWLHFPAIAILTNSLILFSIIVYFRKMLKNKTNKNWESFLKLYNFCICSKIIRGTNIRGFLLLHVKCLCTKIHSTPGMYFQRFENIQITVKMIFSIIVNKNLQILKFQFQIFAIFWVAYLKSFHTI